MARSCQASFSHAGWHINAESRCGKLAESARWQESCRREGGGGGRPHAAAATAWPCLHRAHPMHTAVPRHRQPGSRIAPTVQPSRMRGLLHPQQTLEASPGGRRVVTLTGNVGERRCEDWRLPFARLCPEMRCKPDV